MTTELYRTCPIKRDRRTKNDIKELSLRLYEVVFENKPMTVRQVFYQMTSRGYIPKTETAYKGIVCRLLADLRLNNTIPFDWIADNTRWMRKPDTYSNAEEMLRNNKEFYRRALWVGMPAYVEVWIEKDALAGIVYDVTSQWDVPLMVTKGYSSLSYIYSAAQTMKAKKKPVYIYYMGDYDPSGLDIARTLEQRIREFAPETEIHFQRIAVTENQIRMWNLPTRPTKTTDTRAKNFDSNTSVELDAIPPQMLRDITQHYILQHIDSDVYLNLTRIEALERESLEIIADNIHFHNDGQIGISESFRKTLLAIGPENKN